MASPKTSRWTEQDIPNLPGRRVIVTGASSGLGAETARALAEHGAAVTLAVRDHAKGMRIAEGISGDTEVAVLDLSDLSSVRRFADEWSNAHPEGLDLLINNAGVMAIPRTNSADGFEMQLATNHLGHFALTGLLMPALVAVPNSRVVTVSSSAHRMVRGINFDDINSERRYRSWGAYGQSKLANLLFTSELQRRLSAAGVSTKAMAAHPGYSATNLQHVGPSMRNASLELRITQALNSVVGQSPAMGALPTLFAATAPGLPGDSYIGPNGPAETRGYPVRVGRTKAAQDMAAALRLWQVSEALTGVVFPLD
jgi:NAD(P)-dependent dehydrogenase (short-subunit alcohol dehydrogenase family)